MHGKINIYQFAFFLGLVFYPLLLSAQDINNIQKSDNKIIIEGKVYLVHVIKPGQTLYAISKAYGVQEKEIALENPGVYSGLQIGQVLKIPYESSFKTDDSDKDDSKYIIRHELEAGQTIYQLSQAYNVPVSAIEKMNPNLDYTNLSVGFIVLIPPHSLTKEEDAFYYHKVRKRETIYSLSRQYEVDKSEIYRNNPELEIEGLKTGQIIRIPKLILAMVADSISEETIIETTVDSSGLIDFGELLELERIAKKMKNFNRPILKVAFLIPFDYYPEIEQDSILKEGENVKIEINLEEERMKKLPKSVNFLEFFEGSLMAIEKLKAEGINVDAKFYDTQKSPAKVRSILASSFMQDVDLIIGPFYSWNVEIVNEFSKEKGIPLISPFYEDRDLLSNSPFLFQMNPSYKIEFNAAAKILAKDYDKNFLFIYGTDSLNMKKVDYFKESLLGALSQYTYEENIVLKELVYENAATSDLSNDLSLALSKDKKNIVVIPETNEAFVSSIIIQLYFQLRDFDIEVFGMPHFSGFENVEQQYFHSLNLRYVTPYYYSYSDSVISDFLMNFRTKYKAEPVHSTRKGCSYAFLGYDLSYFFINAISREHKSFVKKLDQYNTDNILIPLHFFRESNYRGFENYNLDLVEYKSDFVIEILDVSNLPFEIIESIPSSNSDNEYY